MKKKNKKIGIKRKICIISIIITSLILAGYFYVFLSTRPKISDNFSELNKHEKLTELMTGIKEEFDIPALGIIVVDHEKIIDKVLIGTREIGKNSTPTFNDHFHLGSNTKALTGFIAGKMVEDGIISWDTKFFDLFPELKNESREEYYEITFKDLLSHRAHLLPFETEVSETLEKIPVDLAARDKRIEFSKIILKENPVEQSYKYSNAGYALAASMMEKASEISWEELIQKIFVEDLNLSVNIGWPIDINENQPRGHLPGSYIGETNNDLIVFDTEYHNINEEILNPSGELNMDMLDYARFIQLNLQGLKGTDNFLSSETYNYIHFGIPDYSIGWENSKEDGELISQHSGSKGNFFCHVCIAPGKDMAIILFANSGILNALNPVERFIGGMKLDNYLKKITEIEEYK